jgi:hypothetical protein
MLHNDELVAKVASALLRSELFEQAGELYEKVNQTEKAFDCYRKAQAFARAIELARFVSPSGTELFLLYLLPLRASRILMNHETAHFISPSGTKHFSLLYICKRAKMPQKSSKWLILFHLQILNKSQRNGPSCLSHRYRITHLLL